MKKVLIITYYWPPAAGTGTQRCLKFARHLPSYGWQAIIFTNSDRSQHTNDDSLAEELPENIEVLSVAAWEPYSLYRLFTGRSKSEAATPHITFDKKPGIRDRFSRWVRDNYFIPDARKFWIKPSVKFLLNYLVVNKIDAILTSGPPHSTHLIGLSLKKKFPHLKWVADFRDPWMHINTYHRSAITSSAHQKQLAMEKEVLTNADEVITVSDQIRDELSGKVTVAANKFHTITNSFDLLPTGEEKKRNNKFVITHAGTLYTNRSSPAFWKVLSELTKENAAFRGRFELNLVGKVEAGVFEQINAAGLQPYLRYTDFVTHKEALQEMAASDILLVMVNNVPESGGIVTGKFFEYLGTGKPILAIGPEKGNLADIMRETNCGFMVGYSDDGKMKSSVLDIFSNQFQKSLTNRDKYSAEEVTGRLTKIL